MKIGFMCAGQGAQAVGMGADLYASSPAAKAVFDEADIVLKRGVARMCFDGPMEDLTASAHCQPAIYTMTAACLAALLERVDIKPVICGGLSLGEFAAAYAAGVFPFSDGLTLVAKRGELMGEACRRSDGGMAAVLNADPRLVETICAETGIDVANFNCPGQIVISGRKDGVEKAVQSLKDSGVSKVIVLQVDGAFHSRLMAPAAEAFTPLLAGVSFADPVCALVQNVTGASVHSAAEIRENLAAQVTGSVRWEDCLRTMLDTGVEALVELGPGKVLNGFMKRVDRRFPVYNVADTASLAETVEALKGSV
ncbi:MAG: ACP S-malonyltransferase [Lentisphaeria bacterium]|nr:ACP S-malonyltransferase [Lentisphaeria bacterium]